MKSTIKSIIAVIVLTIGFQEISAQQDPNFTLYNFNMNVINPAFAGTTETPELNMVYRSQWLGIEDAPRTISLAYSRSLGKNLGIGISVINDKVFVLSETDIAVDFSYKVQVDELTNVYFGLKAGGGFVDIDLSRTGAPGNDPLFMENQSFFNAHVGAGINIQNPRFYISLSTPNFLKGDRYEKQGNAPSAAIDNVHFYLGGGYHFPINDQLTLTPRFMMRTVEGAPTSYDVGAQVEIKKNIIAGANYRIDEMYSIYGLMRVIDNLKLGIGYDFTQSDVNLVNDDGSLEIILKYQF